MRTRWFAVLGFGIAAAAVVRRVSLRTGASRTEAAVSRPGDEIIAWPTTVWNRGTTVRAKASEIWPWLVQMGYGRAGFYAPWWVDELVWRVPSPNRQVLMPEHAHISVGDVLADGPEYLAYWRVEVVEPERTLVLWTRRHPWRGSSVDPADASALEKRERDLLEGGLYIECSWAFYLDEQDSGDTRLLLRTRGVSSPWWLRWLPYGLLDACLSHAVLGTIKRLVAADRRSRGESGARATSSAAGQVQGPRIAERTGP